MRVRTQVLSVGAGVAMLAATLQAEVVAVQDPLFSRPLVSLEQVASPFLYGTGWTTAGPASSYVEIAQGVFANVGAIVWQNPPTNDPRHIDNLVADESIALADLPTSGTFNLPYEAAASLAAETGHEFSQTLTTTFEPGKVYSLSVGVGHNYGSPQQVPAANAKLRLVLYYLDANDQRQVVAETGVFNNAAAGLTYSHMKDFSATSSLLNASDLAVGKPIGILLATDGPAGGYFNLSNVRVSAVPEPAMMGVVGGGLCLMLARRRTRGGVSA